MVGFSSTSGQLNAGLNPEHMQGGLPDPRLVEWRGDVKKAWKFAPLHVPPGDVIAHPGRPHLFDLLPQQQERLRAFDLGPPQVQVHRMVEHRQAAPAGEQRLEAREAMAIRHRQRRAVLDEVEQTGLGGDQRKRIRAVLFAEVGRQPKPQVRQRL